MFLITFMNCSGRPIRCNARNVRAQTTVTGPDGASIVEKQSVVYLGGLLNSDDWAEHGLSRRMGKAGAEFDVLRRAWSRTLLWTDRKIRIFDAGLLSYFSYSLNTMRFGATARRRMDGFHARCFRKILGVPHAYYSRVSLEVLQRAGRQPFSATPLEQQLLIFGGIASADERPIRHARRVPGTLN